jgi:hypothetical protein
VMASRLNTVEQTSAKGPSHLALKMAEVMAEVGRVPKRGYNDFHGYEYPLESDILDAIREKLADRNVMWFPSVENVTREGTLTTLIGRVEFVDAESGEVRSVGMVGTGEDKGDKGVYKAFTGAVKYCLLKTFMISTGDDPESDAETDRRASGGAQRKGQAKGQPRSQNRSQGAKNKAQGTQRNQAQTQGQQPAKPSKVATKEQIKEAYVYGKNNMGLDDETLGSILEQIRGKQTTEGMSVAEIEAWKAKMIEAKQMVAGRA